MKQDTVARSTRSHSQVFGLSSFGITAVMLTVLCAIIGIFSLIIYDARSEAYTRASIEVGNLSQTITQDIERNIELYALSIQGVLEALSNPALAAVSKDLRQLILFDRAATAPYLGAILVMDQTGRVILDSASTQPRSFNYADREYFQAHARSPDLGLYVSAPIASKTDGSMIIGLSRRIDNPDGSFGGVVVGTLRLEYFHRLFSRLNLGRTGSITLLREDGVVIMREPFDPAIIGRKINPTALFEHLALAPHGNYVTHSVVDGIERLNAYQRLRSVPLIQVVARSTADIYADWNRRAFVLSGILATCCALIALLTMRMKRELARRVEAESALMLIAEEDALTGIANRRRFDTVLSTEWQRAIRHRTPLTILIIDADHFKAYNDSFGHPAGDRALKALAACLKQGARRPGELAARYGGEEFAIILPHTDAAAAMQAAEAVRHTVFGLNLPHPSALGRFSISIGVASFTPASDDRLDAFVGTADAALYASKSRGRNCSTLLEHAALTRAA